MTLLVKALGWVLLIAGAALVLAGIAGIAVKEGMWAAFQTLNPFNVLNVMAIIATLAPGTLLLMWAERLGQREKSRGQNPSR